MKVAVDVAGIMKGRYEVGQGLSEPTPVALGPSTELTGKQLVQRRAPCQLERDQKRVIEEPERSNLTGGNRLDRIQALVVQSKQHEPLGPNPAASEERVPEEAAPLASSSRHVKALQVEAA